ncbi:hypothetical protein BDV96DRAFT_694264 [Lophiotrema nucula]|uniref:Transcriptional regulator n=1 Tax=Lophiotrema nucula TaxID=690887 RepID=A0A6A5YH72_9PLEO|nr:hypothetical protein BDV96DRAFT_694264 [Lophiotrema nucula]
MSDSETGDVPIPSKPAISRALKDTVIATYKEGNTDDLTVKRIRVKVEQQLGLPQDFFKTNAQWKEQSHSIILDTVETHCHDDAAPDPEPAPTPKPRAKAKPAKSKPAAPKKTKQPSESSRGVKRSKPAPKAKKPQKRRKTAVSSDEESDAVMSDAPSEKDEDVSNAESEPPKKTAKRKKKVAVEESEDEANGAKPMSQLGIQDEDGGEDTVKSTPAKTKPATPKPELKGDVSESELSELIDESPVKQKRQKKEPAAKKEKASKVGKPAKSKAKAKAPQDDDPDQAEIKRLQGWLVKCGIRKLWGKELAKFDTPKEKIRHLKDMLKDAGMEGKYSVEKAARIKEQRELMADLEAVQQAEQHWGVGAKDGGRPRRRAAATAAARKPVVEDDNDDSDDGHAQDKEEDDKDDDDDDDASEPSQHDGSSDSGSGSDHDEDSE